MDKFTNLGLHIPFLSLYGNVSCCQSKFSEHDKMLWKLLPKKQSSKHMLLRREGQYCTYSLFSQLIQALLEKK